MDALPPALRQALELVSSFGAWDRLRAEQGLGRERAKEVVAEAILATLTARVR